MEKLGATYQLEYALNTLSSAAERIDNITRMAFTFTLIYKCMRLCTVRRARWAWNGLSALPFLVFRPDTASEANLATSLFLPSLSHNAPHP